MRNPVSRFAYVPTDIDIRRSTFTRNSSHKTTFNAGKLIPIFVDEYLPGDTFVLDTSVLARMSTPIHPVMDNSFLDIYFFAVPNRLVWEHWKEFMGESPSDPYLNPIEYSIPQLKAPKYDADHYNNNIIPYGSVLDYIGIPAGTYPESFSALYTRALALIWNSWFRDENLQNAADIDISDSDTTYITYKEYLDDVDYTEPASKWGDTDIPVRHLADSDYYVNQLQRGGACPPVNKYHDYFTSALLRPQKGDPVAIPLNGFAPVYVLNGADSLSFADTVSAFQFVRTDNKNATSGNIVSGNNGIARAQGSVDGGSGVAVSPQNLVADLGSSQSLNKSISAAYATINDLRYAFQIQKLLEADNRYGTRYTEIIKGHFGVDSPDGLLQRPEFLGGKRIRINMQQVLQTSASSDVSPQGNTAAYSLTTDVSSSFTKSFTEHGMIFGVACLRTEHTYQQGIEKQFLRKDRYDFYFPELANISEQPILMRQLYSTFPDDEYLSSWSQDNEVFGFQEAWAEYRYKPNRVSGQFRSWHPLSLDSWHYADDYYSTPYLSSEWIRETKANIDRTLAVSSDVSDQLICDFYFRYKCTRPMPVTSIPGLADHH